jgi:hypothetical protein
MTHTVYAAVLNKKRKAEAQVIFLNLFTIWLRCKRKFFDCPFADGLNGLNELNGLSGLAIYVYQNQIKIKIFFSRQQRDSYIILVIIKRLV